MPAYDSKRFDPPAPLAHVTLRNPETGAALPDVPMLLDSGADVTLIPRAIADELGAAFVPNIRYELEGFDMNAVVLLLDGPRLTWEEQRSG